MKWWIGALSLLSMETVRAENQIMKTMAVSPEYKVTGPLVSVVIPAYNEENYLPALLSALKNQTYSNIEVIVVDNESTDNSVTVASNAGAKVITNHEFNLSMSRNMGAEASKGNIIVFIDADTVPESQAIEEVVNQMDLGYEMVRINTCCTDSHFQGMIRVLRGWTSLIHHAYGGAFIGVSRYAFDSVGGFDETVLVQDTPHIGEDKEFIRSVESMYPSTYLSNIYAGTSGRRQKVEGLTFSHRFQDRAIRQLEVK